MDVYRQIEALSQLKREVYCRQLCMSQNSLTVLLSMPCAALGCNQCHTQLRKDQLHPGGSRPAPPVLKNIPASPAECTTAAGMLTQAATQIRCVEKAAVCLVVRRFESAPCWVHRLTCWLWELGDVGS